jgi:hypothetical protein
MWRVAVSRVLFVLLPVFAVLPLVSNSQLPGQLPKIAYLSVASDRRGRRFSATIA